MALTSIFEMTAEDVMNKKFKTLDINESVSRALAAIDTDGFLNVLVYDNGTYSGYFGYKQLVRLRVTSPETTRLRGLIARSPTIAVATPLLEILEMMYVNDAKIIPVLDDGKVVGVIETTDILRLFPNVKEAHAAPVREIMTPDPISIREEESIAAAVSLFKEQGIVRLPVVDKDHAIQGLLESPDLVKEFRSKPEYGIDMFFGGEGVKAGALSRDIVSAKEIPVKALMKDSFVTAFQDDLLSDKLRELFQREKTTTVVVTDETSRLQGIVAPKDVLHYLLQLKQEQGFFVQSSGIEREESLTDFQKEKVAKTIEETVARLNDVSRIQTFSIHVKTTHHTHGKQHLYHVFCKAVTDEGTFSSRESEWDFVLAAGSALKELESQVMHKVSKQKDVARIRSFDGKKK